MQTQTYPYGYAGDMIPICRKRPFLMCESGHSDYPESSPHTDRYTCYTQHAEYEDYTAYGAYCNACGGSWS